MNIPAMRKIFEENIYKAMDRLALMMEAKAIALAPKALGQLAKHIHSRTEIKGQMIIATLECTAEYGKYLEQGTGPAVGHKKYLPPKGALQTWVNRILGAKEEDIDKTEDAVRWHIYHYGTKPQPFMTPAAEYGAQQIKQVLKDGIANAIKEIRSELR